MISINRNWILTAMLAVLALWIINKSTPVTVSHNVQLTITKNKAAIFNLYQARDVESTRTVWVDKIDLEDKLRFSHPKLGNVAEFTDNFFVDINHTIRVKKAGDYQFFVSSDDGYAISVNGKKICEFVTDRPFTPEVCDVNLPEGNHLINITYFQGGGLSGLSVEYSLKGEKRHWFGHSSRWVSFK